MQKRKCLSVFLSALALMLGLCLLLAGCQVAPPAPGEDGLTKYSGMFYDSFDTVTQLIGFTETEEQFNAVLEKTRQRMLYYHRIYDGYNLYEGVHNLCEINRDAGKGPVPAERELIDLLLFAKENQPKLDGRVNVAMGAVLSLWHEYREEGTSLPPMEELTLRSEHVDMDDVIIDGEAGTVFFADPEMSLDLGAVAKGYAVERVAEEILSVEMPSYLLSAGGNVRCGERPLDGRDFWGVGIQDPGDGTGSVSSASMDILYLADCSVVTSGDYQRYYEVDGVRYHHIIDPDTLMPSTRLRAVTVVTENSDAADLLSTALFLMPYDRGRAFVDSLDGVEAYWVEKDGAIHYTGGLVPFLASEGAAANLPKAE